MPREKFGLLWLGLVVAEMRHLEIRTVLFCLQKDGATDTAAHWTCLLSVDLDAPDDQGFSSWPFYIGDLNDTITLSLIITLIIRVCSDIELALAQSEVNQICAI